jgi:hypothetical protein
LHKICLGVAFTTLMKQMKQNPWISQLAVT